MTEDRLVLLQSVDGLSLETNNVHMPRLELFGEINVDLQQGRQLSLVTVTQFVEQWQ